MKSAHTLLMTWLACLALFFPVHAQWDGEVDDDGSYYGDDYDDESDEGYDDEYADESEDSYYFKVTDLTNDDKFQEALPIALEWVQEEEKKNNADKTELILALHYAGEIYFELEKYPEAAQEYERSISLSEKQSRIDTVDLVREMGYLADAYQSSGLFSKAEDTYNKGIALGEKGGKESINKASDLADDLARMHNYDTQDFSAAQKAARKSIALLERNYGPNTETARHAYCQLAYAYRMQKKYDEAEKYIRIAIDMNEKYISAVNMDNDKATKASFLMVLGLIFDDQEKNDDEFNAAQQSLSIIQGLYHPTDYSCIMVKDLGMLGDVSFRRNNDTEAEQYYRQALTYESQSTNCPTGFSDVYNGLALVCERTNRSSDAVTFITKAKEYTEKEKHPSENIRNNYAKITGRGGSSSGSSHQMPTNVSRGLLLLTCGGLFDAVGGWMLSTSFSKQRKLDSYYDLFQQQPSTSTWSTYQTQYNEYKKTAQGSYTMLGFGAPLTLLGLAVLIFGHDHSTTAAIYEDDHFALSLTPAPDRVVLDMTIKGGRQ